MLRVFWDAAVSVDPQADAADEKRMRLCREGQLTELWKGAGLAGVEEKPLEFTMRFASFADYWEPFLLGQGPAGAFVRRLAPDRVTALRTELKRRVGISGEDVPFDLPARAWAVRGRAGAKGG
jgi:hypothetical protein